MAEVRDAPKEVSENQRCEDNPCSAAHYSPLSSNLLRDIVKGTEQSCCAQAECSGPTGHAVGHVEFQRQRADISDGQSLIAGQYYYIIIKPRAALAETMHGVQSYPVERPIPPWSRQDQPPAGGGDCTPRVPSQQSGHQSPNLRRSDPAIKFRI